jgi:hypothetical protein
MEMNEHASWVHLQIAFIIFPTFILWQADEVKGIGSAHGLLWLGYPSHFHYFSEWARLHHVMCVEGDSPHLPNEYVTFPALNNASVM